MTSAGPAVFADFDGFYQVHFRETVSIVYGYTGDLGEAQDIAQEAFARAWQRWSAVSAYDNPVYWVRRVATNMAHSRFRRVRVAAAYLVRQRPDNIPELSPDSVDIINALKQIPVAQRKAVVLHYLVDMPVEDVAQELGVPLGTVKSWLHRGRAALSVQLADEVSRSVGTPEVEGIRAKAARKQASRRSIAVAASIVVVLAVVLGIMKFGASPSPVPVLPASPSPSISPSPATVGLPTACVPERLPLPSEFADSQVEVSDGDPTGRYLIGKMRGDSSMTYFIWENGKLIDHFPMAKAEDYRPAINSSGLAIGVVRRTGTNRLASWVYNRGIRTGLVGEDAIALGINSAGSIVGQASTKPVIWRSPEATPESLPLLPSRPDLTGGGAFGVSDGGFIVGLLSGPSAPTAATFVAWKPDGSILELPSPNSSAIPQSISIRGDVALATYSVGQIRWNVRTNTQERVRTPHVDAMNSLGLQARRGGGPTSSTNLGVGDDQAFMKPGDDLRNGHDSLEVFITVIAEDGKTLGGTLRSQTLSYAVRWRCS